MDMENICVIEIECFGFNAEIIKELAFCNKYFNGAVAFSPSLLHQVIQTETDRRHNAFITRTCMEYLGKNVVAITQN